MATNDTTRRVVFGSKGQPVQAPIQPQQAQNIPDSVNDMPNWDEPPMEAYAQDNAPPQEFDDTLTPDSYGIAVDLESNRLNEPEAEQKPQNSVYALAQNTSPEIYAYPRVIRAFNQSVKFGLGINYELAKKTQQEEVARRKQQTTNNATPSQPQQAPAPQRRQEAPQQPSSKAPVQQTPAASRQESNNSYNANMNASAPAPANQAPARAKPQNVSNNIAYLDSTPLLIIMDHFCNPEFFSKEMPAKHLYNNVFEMNRYKIRVNVEENKWYNIDTKRGNTNALSLARELIAIHDDLNLNDPECFRLACSKATKEVNTIQRNIERYTNLDELIALTKEKQSQSKNAGYKSSGPAKTQEEIIKEEAEKAQQSKEAWNAIRDHLNSIPMREIAEWLGATPNEDNNPNLWKFHTTGHNVSINGQQWKNWNHSGNGGVGAIGFMKQYISITESIPETEDKVLYKKAFNALMKEFGDMKGQYILSGDDFKTAFCFPHILPGKTKEIKYYLNGERGIPNWIINKQISNGVLFAGFPSDWEPDKLLRESEKMKNDRVWATFLAPNGMAAEMRGIANNLPAKVLAKGSEKNTGGYLVPAEPQYNENVLAICEAAVDATSYSSLYPGRSSTSVMGVNVELAIELMFEADEKGLKSYISFDNDYAGNCATYQFHKKVLDQVEEEDYENYLKEGKIKYFELASQIFKESLKTGITFYFDMDSKVDGMEASNLFLRTLFREMDREDVKNHLIKGRLKVNNVCPKWAEIKDPDLEAKTAVEMLKKNYRYYYYPEDIKPLSDVKEKDPEKEAMRQAIHEGHIQRRKAFMEAFEKHAGPENLILWKMDKRIADSIEPIAKDWNEWMKYQLAHNKELKKEFDNREIEFKHYDKKVQQMTPSDLGNNEKIKRIKP